MKIGFNCLFWTTHVTQNHFHWFEKLKNAGYDGVEVPVFEGEPEHFSRIRNALDDSGLDCTAVTVIPDPQRSPISEDRQCRQAALEYMRWALRCSQALKAEVLCGPFYQPLGAFSGAGPSPEEIKRAQDVLAQAAESAADADVVLALESLNRFESYLLNTTQAAADFARQIHHPNFGILFDTFHANIEEEDPVGCITPHIEVIKHVHISENNRGVPGRGHIDWQGTFQALRASGYDNWLTVEAFSRALPALAAATRVWRDFAPTREEVYREAISFIKRQWRTAQV